MNKPRRFVRMFKPRFAAMVKDGLKLQTVRPGPKRMPRPGDVIDCRMWEGKAYRSKQVRLCEGMITEVLPVRIEEDGLKAGPWLLWPGSEEACGFARLDGFRNYEEMREWFAAEHGLPFEGVVICWEKVGESAAGSTPLHDEGGAR